MNVFIIFEFIGEESHFHFVSDVDDEDLDVLDQANNKYINSDDDIEAVNMVSEMLGEEGKWARTRLDVVSGLPVYDADDVSCPIDRVYVMGMVL